MKVKALETRKAKTPSDLDFELFGKEVVLMTSRGEVVRGRIIAYSRYWIKVESSDGFLYINKAYIVWMKPAD